MFGLFKKKQKNCLGIDLGTSGVKIVELSRAKNGIFLENYALAQTSFGSAFNVAKLAPEQIAALLRHIFYQAGIKTKQAVISLPVGETFSTIISLPTMPEEELAQAIPYEARKYVPVPIEEVVLDWSIVGQIAGAPQNEGKNDLTDSSPALTNIKENKDSQAKQNPPGAKIFNPSLKTIQVLIVAVPQEVIKKIAQIAKIINLQVLAVEQEAFSIARALVNSDRATYLICDLGKVSIDLIVFDEGTIKLTHTFDKTKPENLDLEISKIISLFEIRYLKKIEKLIFTGGGITQREWLEALSQKLKVALAVGDPFRKISYNQKLEPMLEQIKPFMAVAVGAAMREL